ncbi:MAG: matrixin family metalloprotease [Sandaracinaceae bacterium]|nr:matrixin family metalloprotease [Sandaracinaceae bacterium]
MTRALSFVLVSLCLIAPAAHAAAWCRLTTVDPPSGVACSTQGIPLWWDHRCTSYALFEDYSKSIDPNDIRSAFQQSFATWTDVVCPDGHPIGFQVRQLEETSTCDHASTLIDGTNIHTMVFLQEWGGLRSPDAFALTSTWNIQETGQILDVDMEINEADWTFELCPATGCTNGHVDLQNVITHEAGHYFGLGHSVVANATMFMTAGANETSKRDLEADDIEGICSAYPQGSLPDACDDAPWNGFAANLGCGDPLPKGCCSVAPGAQNASSRGVLSLVAALAAIALGRSRRKR